VRDPNVSGQAYAFMAMTPVKDGELEPLQTYLRGLDAAGPSPFEKLSRTHIARFVVVTDFHNDPTSKQRKDEHLDRPYLIFTSNLDGDVDTYLNELCKQLAAEAKQIWGRCIGCPDRAEGPALKQYLLHNQIKTGIFYAPYGHATTRTVKRVLSQREQLIEFAVASQGLDDAALQASFVDAFARARRT
jgi:hypothetical protein